MNILLDKLAVVCLCMVIAADYDFTAVPVIIVLTSVIFSAAAQYLYSKKFSPAVIAVYGVLCIFYPPFCCGIPLQVYDLVQTKKYTAALPCLLGVALNLKSFSVFQLAVLAASVYISVLLSLKASRLAETSHKLIKIRDSSAEVNMLLMEKNKNLLNRQDYEIYLATLKERNRIAREIHDNVGHMLTRSILQIGALLIINKDEVQRESLESIKDTLNSAMTSIRSSVHDLHDDSIDLRQSVRECVKSMENDYEVRLDFDISEYVPRNIKLCFIGVVKESLSNIVKHSCADKLQIIIREHPGFYQLAIEDNGSCSTINESGIGLSNMRDRAESVGGIISFTPSAEGFKVFLSVAKKMTAEEKNL